MDHLRPAAPVRQVVIPVAGRGTRLFPATKVVPKVLLPVGRRPLIHYAVEEAVHSGAERVVLVTDPNDSQVRAYFEPNPELERCLEDAGRAQDAALLRHICNAVSIVSVQQRIPRGLADSIRCAQRVLGEEPFAVILPDALILGESPCTGQLIYAYRQHGGTIIATRQVEPYETDRYGILVTGENKPDEDHRTLRVLSMVEKPKPDAAPSRYGVFGRYVLEPGIFEAISATTEDASGEVQLTDALNLFCRSHPVFGHLFEGEHFDTGGWLGLAQANAACTMADPELGAEFSRYLLSKIGGSGDLASKSLLTGSLV